MPNRQVGTTEVQIILYFSWCITFIFWNEDICWDLRICYYPKWKKWDRSYIWNWHKELMRQWKTKWCTSDFTMLLIASEENCRVLLKDSNDPWYSVIANINIHNAYHIQTVYIRKLQGSWGKWNVSIGSMTSSVRDKLNWKQKSQIIKSKWLRNLLYHLFSQYALCIFQMHLHFPNKSKSIKHSKSSTTKKSD